VQNLHENNDFVGDKKFFIAYASEKNFTDLLKSGFNLRYFLTGKSRNFAMLVRKYRKATKKSTAIWKLVQ